MQGRRRNRITDEALVESLKDLQDLPLTIQPPPAIGELPLLKELSDRHKLNAYDAIYFALSQSLRLPLATNDAALIRACIAEGVDVL